MFFGSSLADKLSTHKVKSVTSHIYKLQDFVNAMLRLQVDEHEFAYLKAIMLFSPGMLFFHLLTADGARRLRERVDQCSFIFCSPITTSAWNNSIPVGSGCLIIKLTLCLGHSITTSVLLLQYIGKLRHIDAHYWCWLTFGQ